MTDTVLIDRIRTALAGETDIREVNMFGGLAFIVREHLLACVSIAKNTLLLRVAPADHARYLQQTGVSQAEMGAGRRMGTGWIILAHSIITSDADLYRWLDIALTHNRSLPPKKTPRKRGKS